MPGNIGNLLVKCMQQITKGHIPSVGGIRLLFNVNAEGPVSLVETSAKVINGVSDSRWFCELL